MFEDKQSHFLREHVKRGEVVLFLGAGASHGCLNGRRDEVVKAAGLEAIFRKELNEYSEDISLGELAEDLQDLGAEVYNRILREQFLDCTPSQELLRLMRYTWYRCYTLNYDDSILKIPRHERVQVIRPFTRKNDVDEIRDFNVLQTVFLNGSIQHPDEGFILTDKEYRTELRKSGAWHKKCAQDFSNRAFVFLGTKLNEPIFEAHIEELERGGKTSYTKSFLISPSKPSERKIRKLKEKNIHFVEGTLGDFVGWLESNVGEGLSPKEIASQGGVFKVEDRKDANIAKHLNKIGSADWLEKHQLTGIEKQIQGRDFYSGLPPTWQTVVADIPAKLSSFSQIKKFLVEAQNSSEGGICLVTGQSGSGKATALMSAILEYVREDEQVVYELKDGEDINIESVIEYVGGQANGKRVSIFIPNLHLFVDVLEMMDRACARYSVNVIGQIRLADWRGRFGRKSKSIRQRLSLSKLTSQDYERLANGLDQFAVAPEFRKLSRLEKIQLLKKSNRQLLIIMLEVTKQRKFEEIIEDEFNSIEDYDVRIVFCLVALVGIARGRLELGEFKTIVEDFGVRSTFSSILDRLDGIVEVSPSGYLVGRHSLYASHALKHSINPDTIKEAVVALLESFTIYQEPFVKNAGRAKGNLLKFLIRASFLKGLFRAENRNLIGQIYQEIEFSYQNDGHYWLQRGKYNQSRYRHQEALKHFHRAVEAYPNEFARHSLAHQKLVVCALSQSSTPKLRNLLAEGVAELERQIKVRADAEDEYPITALARMHPEVLLKWGDQKGAMKYAREYFERLQVFNKGLSYRDKTVEDILAQCLHLSTQGKWKRDKIRYF